MDASRIYDHNNENDYLDFEIIGAKCYLSVQEKESIAIIRLGKNGAALLIAYLTKFTETE